MTEQSQRGGANSTNVQVIQAGPTTAELRVLVLDIVQAELYRYQQVGEATAHSRYEKITDDVLRMVASKGAGAAAAFADPDIQYSTATVGREYARAGDDDLGEVLVGLLGDRIDAKSRSLLAVVLNDAIQIAARLTDRELDALSLAWRLLRTSWSGMTSLEALNTYLLEQFKPFSLPDGEASYLHLESLGCVAVQPFSETTFGAAFINNYPGMFSKGFTNDDVPEELKPWLGRNGIFTTCLRDLTKLQVNAVDDAGIEAFVGLEDVEDAATKLKAIEASHRMSVEEVEKSISAMDPALETLIERWNGSLAKNIRVSAVGTAIAHANYRRVTGLDAALSIWIS